MNRIVFLDIDGVLNTIGDKNLIDNTFEKTKLENLVCLLLDSKSSLVIISDRRLISEERIKIDNLFDNYLILVNYLNFKRTHKNRSDEIIEYLNNYPCKNYVILDDNDLGYSDNEILKSHFIDTYKKGFTRDLYYKALKVLGLSFFYSAEINEEGEFFADINEAKAFFINGLEQIKMSIDDEINQLIKKTNDLTEDLIVEKYQGRYGIKLSIFNADDTKNHFLSLKNMIGG